MKAVEIVGGWLKDHNENAYSAVSGWHLPAERKLVVSGLEGMRKLHLERTTEGTSDEAPEIFPAGL